MNKSPSFQKRQRQRGVVLLFCLIILVVLLAGGVAVVRSMNSSLFGAGNMAFKRDLLNQGQQAVVKATSLFATGGALVGASAQSRADLNYSAVQLATNAQGIPSALLGNDESFAAIGRAANDLTGATPDVKVRYVIERLCSAAGAPTSATCVQSQSAPMGGSAVVPPPPPPPTATVYRLTARVTGPRDTQVFLQTSFSKPD